MISKSRRALKDFWLFWLLPLYQAIWSSTRCFRYSSWFMFPPLGNNRYLRIEVVQPVNWAIQPIFG